MRRLIMCTLYSGAYISCSYNGPIDFNKSPAKMVEKSETFSAEVPHFETQSFEDVFKKASDLGIYLK